MINTPMDALNMMKGKTVTVISKTREKIKGKLIAFDLNQNLSIDTVGGLRFLQGNNVSDISMDE